MSKEELEREIRVCIGHDDECSIGDGTINKCDCGTFRTTKEIMQAIAAYVAEVIGKDERCPCKDINCPITRVNEEHAEQRLRTNISQPVEGKGGGI